MHSPGCVYWQYKPRHRPALLCRYVQAQAIADRKSRHPLILRNVKELPIWRAADRECARAEEGVFVSQGLHIDNSLTCALFSNSHDEYWNSRSVSSSCAAILSSEKDSL